jgi:hypothetical protein
MTNNEKQTAWNDSGGSKTQFIDRHNVDCLPNAISAFKLERKGEQMRYLYTCAQGLFGPAVGAGTAENEGGGGRMEYLDRHNVECPANMAIAQFKLNSKNDGNTRTRGLKDSNKMRHSRGKSKKNELSLVPFRIMHIFAPLFLGTKIRRL